MKQPDLYHFETMQMTSQGWSKFTIILRLVFSRQNLTRLVTSFLWFQNSIDQHCKSRQTESACIATSKCVKVTTLCHCYAT